MKRIAPASRPWATSRGREITTIEAVGASPLVAVQEAWLNLEVVQCGQSDQIMSAVALLESNPSPSDEDIDAGMTGNICRCGTYIRIRRAIKEAANAISQKGAGAYDDRFDTILLTTSTCDYTRSGSRGGTRVFA